MRNVIALLFATFMLYGPVSAATGDSIDLQTRYGRYYQTFHINEDGTADESFEWSRTILKEAALENSKSASVSYSTSAQKAEVVAAYTLKTNGRRIDVPKNNYQLEVKSGKGNDSPVYSDRTTLTVIFPDVAVGDTVVFSYKLKQIEPLFPKHYSTSQTFYDQVAIDDIRVRFDYPTSLWVQYEARGMNEVENSTKDGRKVIEWRHSNPNPVKTERRNYSVFDPDKEVGFAFSTFKSYAEIASSYGERALPKAAVTSRIEKLAAEIVRDKTDQKDQARALYEWVARNITYAGNCIGIGAVVPRDVPFILDNKIGDCKDRATLLQALLAARGIKSAQALVNAGSTYQLSKIPVVATVNHVINYLPAFDLYVDSTSDSTPFGMLPFSDQDKPVLLVEGFKAGMRTPAASASSDKYITKSFLKISSDGAASGSVEVFQNGQGAVQTRAWARQLTKDVEEDLVKDVFRRQGIIGAGKLEKDDPKELSDVYHYKVSLSGEKYLKLPGAGAFQVYPPLGFGTSIQGQLQYSLEPEKEADVTCSGGEVTEEYTIELPKTLKVLSMPDDLDVANELVHYKASYKIKDNVLKVTRQFVDRTKGNVCSPKVMMEYKKIGEKVMDNLREQILYK